MSKDHHFFTESEMRKSIETPNSNQRQEMQKLEADRLKSMYVKFDNPHDIIADKGLVKVHKEEVELEKVRDFKMADLSFYSFLYRSN